jgi:hypothetical protein
MVRAQSLLPPYCYFFTIGFSTVKLNDARMLYRGISIWPPLWIEQQGDSPTRRDESGMLIEVRECLDCDKCYLYTRHENKMYVGCLLFEDADDCKFVTALLKEKIGKQIRSIGDTEISEKLEVLGAIGSFGAP